MPDRDQLPEDVIREALNRATAAILTLAMETLRAQTNSVSGEVPDSTFSKVVDVYEKVLTLI